ncbi:MAG: hypothetical protein ACYC4R_01220 [Anaerolineae bacterium]
MGLLDKLRELFAGGGASTGADDPHGMWFYFRCKRCGSIVRVRADRRNDFNREDEGPGALVLRKEVMDNKCFQLMRAELWLDENYQIVDSTIVGGELSCVEEYEETHRA